MTTRGTLPCALMTLVHAGEFTSISVALLRNVGVERRKRVCVLLVFILRVCDAMKAGICMYSMHV